MLNKIFQKRYGSVVYGDLVFYRDYGHALKNGSGVNLIQIWWRNLWGGE